MEKIPEIINRLHLPVEINLSPYIKDHQFAGRIVLPAVESCCILAENIKNNLHDINPYRIVGATFGKFLELKPDETVHAFNDIDIYNNGKTVSKLSTKTKSPKGITRTNEHAVMSFEYGQKKITEITYETASSLEGICMRLSSDIIYRDLVPFGPAFHNLKNVFISRHGALAEINAESDCNSDFLGSTLVFDAALHAADIWGQRYTGVIAYPVSFEERIILKPCETKETYYAKIHPVNPDPDGLIFNIWIYDSSGNLREAGFGIKIKDTNSGILKPPAWIIDDKINPLKNISDKCEFFTIVELDAVTPYADKSLSGEEIHRMQPMREKRRRSYKAARLASKNLSRKIAGDTYTAPAESIVTISGIYPVCSLPEGIISNCTVSHDSRFAIAAAARSKKRIGIDVEDITDKILKTRHLFMTKEEMIIADLSGLGQIEASLRVWSIKESVTKALGINLGESWERAHVITLGTDTSTFMIDGKKINAYHDTIENHLFTFVQII